MMAYTKDECSYILSAVTKYLLNMKLDFQNLAYLTTDESKEPVLPVHPKWMIEQSNGRVVRHPQL